MTTLRMTTAAISPPPAMSLDSRLPTWLTQIRQWALLFSLWLGFSTLAWSQSLIDNPDWKESDAPPPPSFELKRLVPFDGSVNSTLKWGFDPETMKITNDGIVRYVVVAQSPSGVVNAMYEAVRCATGEWKSYARYHNDSGWSLSTDPQWRPLSGQISSHALRLANQGLCTGRTPANSVRDVVRSVRQTEYIRP